MLYVHWLELENVPVVGVVILPVTVQPPGLELVGDVTLYVIRAASTGDEDIATTTAKATRAQELKNLFMRESPLVGSTTSWKANEKPCRRVWSSGPRTVALVALVARGD